MIIAWPNWKHSIYNKCKIQLSGIHIFHFLLLQINPVNWELLIYPMFINGEKSQEFCVTQEMLDRISEGLQLRTTQLICQSKAQTFWPFCPGAPSSPGRPFFPWIGNKKPAYQLVIALTVYSFIDEFGNVTRSNDIQPVNYSWPLTSNLFFLKTGLVVTQ